MGSIRKFLVILVVFALIGFTISNCEVENKDNAETVKAPAANPAAGTYTSAQNVTLSSETEDAIIYYTVDGSAPTSGSTRYISPIAISHSLTLKAIAAKKGMNNSPVFSAEYVINIPIDTVIQPVATPGAGTYTTVQSVTLSTTTTGASIYYTINGADPTASSTPFTTGSPITINQSLTLKAIAVKEGMTNSSILTADYVINLASMPELKENHLVSIVQSTKPSVYDLSEADVEALVREAVTLAGGLDDLIKNKGAITVALKPNIVLARDNTGANWSGQDFSPEASGIATDWRVTRAVAKIVKELNPLCTIMVIEGSEASSTTTTANYNKLKYTAADMPEVNSFIAIESDSGSWRGNTVTLANVHNGTADLVSSRPGLLKISHPTGLLHKTYYFNKKFYEADVVICLPVLKNHWDAAVTGTIKNISIGATPGNIYGQGSGNNNRNSMIDHGTTNFHKWIADYYTLRPADFTIMDGLQASEFGPSVAQAIYGTDANQLQKAQLNMRTIIAAKDGLAHDIVLSNLVNFDPLTVGYLTDLMDASEAGRYYTKNIVVVGKKVDDLRDHVLNFTRASTTYKGEFRGREPTIVAGNTDYNYIFGRKIDSTNNPYYSPDNKTPPTLSITSASFSGNDLLLNLNASSSTDKLDIYIDNAYAGSVKDGFANVTFPTTGVASGSRNITVYAYNRFMYHTAASRTVTK